MANNVFANGREISCKKADGKTICAFPDICMTPPTSPATPTGIPIPYPNTGMAKDTTNGSRTVKISGNEIIKKNVSYYKTSYGDEAGCATPAKKGIITGTIQGKVYFTSWSMDVKVEGKNAVRHLDTTTHNHGSNPNEGIPWAHIDTLNSPSPPPKPCKRECKKKKLDPKRKKKLRRKTPSDDARDAVNKEAKKCPVCGKNPAPKRLAADHIVPYNIIQKMPGFTCMSEADQIKIINSPKNFVGLCGSCNSSKGSKLWFKWKKHKSKKLDLSESSSNKRIIATRKKSIKATKYNIKDLKQKIRVADCE